MSIRIGRSMLAMAVGGLALAGVAAELAAAAAYRSDEGGNPAAKGQNMATKYSRSGYDVTPYPREKVTELATKLDAEAFRITQRAGTEAAFCGGLLDNKKEGLYTCVVCGLPLFSSEHKFNSGTGWPSFHSEFDPEHVSEKPDVSHGMVRTEINCARCNAHLGHVFDDGPPPTGQRFCLNSASLAFVEKGQPLPPESQPARQPGDQRLGEAAEGGTETAYFAGGCFWGIEHYFQQGPGVIDAVSGYMQGGVESPSYKQVCSDTTGHAETVKVVFDPEKITYRRLLEAFFAMHDPTQVNRQGPDVGGQYRSGIWYANDRQKTEAEAFIREMEGSGRYHRKIATLVERAKTFYPAEDYHQDHIVKTGGVCHLADPWK